MNSPTLALLRKDRPWLLGFLALGGAVSEAAFLDSGFSNVFVFAHSRFAQDLELLLAPLTILLGLCSTLSDDFRSTRDFLRHRPLTPARIFWTRNLAALCVMVAWMAIGVASTWLHEWLSPFGLEGACANPSVFGALGAMTAGLALVHALVTLSFSLPTRWFHRVWLAALLVFSRYALQSWLGSAAPSWFICVLLLVLGTFVLLLAASRCESAGHDPDRATPGRTLVGAAGVTLAAASLFGAVTMSGWQGAALRGLQRVRPMMGQVDANELGLLSAPDRDWLCTVLAADWTPTERRVPLSRVSYWAPVPEEADFDPFQISALYASSAWYQWMESSSGAVRSMRRIQMREDALRVVEERSHGRSSWILRLPEGSTRSRGATLIELEDGEAEPLFFLAPEVAGLWLLTTETPPRLVEQPLPESDRPRGKTWWTDEAGQGHRAIAGDSRTWLYSAGAWKAVAEGESARAATFTVLDEDPLRPEAELRLRDGPVLRHRYGIEHTSEKLFAALAGLGSILRPAPFALLGAWTNYSAIAEAQPDEALLVLDPLLGGGYGWLLGPNLALTAGLMLLMFRELRRRGASWRRSLGWTLAALCAGVFSGPLLLALEPRRAWRRPARSTPPTALIRAA